MKKLASVVIVLAALAPLAARAQDASSAPPNVADILRSSARRVEAKDLPASYRAVALGDQGMGIFGSFGFMGMAMMGSSGASNRPDEMLLFQLIGATFVEPQEFQELLEGKRPRIRGYTMDLGAMMAASNSATTEAVAAMSADGSTPPAPTKTPMPVFSETWIEAGRISTWTARPELNRDAILRAMAPPDPSAPASMNEAKTRGLSNAKQVATSIMIYMGDYDDVFPKAESTAQAQQAVYPYTKNSSIWSSANPNGGRLLYNTSLSKVSATSLERPAETLLLWDENAWPDGGRIAAFADGHAKYVAAAAWSGLWQAEQARRAGRRGAGAPAPAGQAPGNAHAKAAVAAVEAQEKAKAAPATRSKNGTPRKPGLG